MEPKIEDEVLDDLPFYTWIANFYVCHFGAALTHNPPKAYRPHGLTLEDVATVTLLLGDTSVV